MRLLIVLALLCTLRPAHADGEAAGDFDYYVLSLSWSPSWCALEGDARDADQCDARHDHGFVLHGLWPQYEDGWPSFCRTTARDPSRRQTDAMRDIMGSGGLAWYQWKKHGRCAGLDGAAYLDLARRAYDSVKRPELLRKLTRSIEVAPKVIESAFLEENPDLAPDMVTVTCKADHVQEVRICLTTDLSPRICGRDVRRDCSAQSATLPPIR